MRVREATSDDFGEIARLTVAAYRALDTWVGDDYAAHLADVAARAGAENTMVLVAEDEADGRILGSVTLTLGDGPYFEWAHGVDGDCGFRMLAVDPAASSRIYLASSEGVWHSLDGGATWRKRTLPTEKTIFGITFSCAVEAADFVGVRCACLCLLRRRVR